MVDEEEEACVWGMDWGWEVGCWVPDCWFAMGMGEAKTCGIIVGRGDVK